ncbi:MAG: hypothetical protein HYY16_11380 [Planctomycetes bacterium]|nr:hypothetical protein [Planctomycetota bacterium]
MAMLVSCWLACTGARGSSGTMDAAEARSLYDRIMRADLDKAVSAADCDALLLSEGWLASGLDGLFGLPATLTATVVETGRAVFPRSGCYSLAQEADASMASRILQLGDGGVLEAPCRTFLTHWVERERRYLVDGYGLYPVDQEELQYEQRNVLFDAFRKTYFSRYVPKMEQRLREDVWRVREWKAIDLALAPPLLAGYTWFRGLDRAWMIAGSSLRVRVEPLERIRSAFDGEEEVLGAAVGLEWGLLEIPLRLIVCAGVRDGEPTLDFIGVGTGLNEARKALLLALGEVSTEP